MCNVETTLAKLSAKNKVYDTLTKVHDLLKNDKSEEAKALLDSTIKSSDNKRNPSSILHRILNMVYKLSESNYKFDDIIEYHSEYRNIIDISGFGNNWIYGDSLNEITEVSEAVVSLASDMLPELYDDLLMQTSKFDINTMNYIFDDIDHPFVELVSKMMLAIEQIDVYNIHYLLLQCDRTPESIFDAVEELECVNNIK